MKHKIYLKIKTVWIQNCKIYKRKKYKMKFIWVRENKIFNSATNRNKGQYKH